MSDYERYGDYNEDPNEERGPARSRGWVIFVRLLRACVICIIFGVCGILAFRMIASGYYPQETKRIHYTDALAAYATGREIYAETQGIRVPFCDEMIISGDDGRLTQSEVRDGYYYADNLILVRDGGSLQLSIRINKNNIDDIAEKYGLSDFTFSETAFTFALYNNKDVSENKTLVGEGLAPTYVSVDSALMYHYVKLCFDNVDFEDVNWMRLEITPNGADTEAEGYRQLGICVYENHEGEAQFKEYKLKKEEKLS